MIEINDIDICTVERELGVTFDTTRKQIIKTFNDVQACPGSGKTTMVAAKLLIIAKKWKQAHQGVCVLTHTNVAKGEIIDRLDRSVDGQKLLSYPHFIGTIQEFVNKFLAIPYLRSNGYNVNQVDDDICCNKGWHLLSRGTRNFLERNHISSLQDLQFKFIDGELKLSVPGFRSISTSASYQNLESVKSSLISDGYFYYHEMYAFARKYILNNSSIKGSLQSRFPVVFVDEMQDTQRFQDELLNEIFQHDNVSFQRFGDPDQAIYSSGEEENQTYNQVTLEKVEDSHRFNNSVALLAKNLSYNRINLNSDTTAPEQVLHTIFLVDENSRHNVFERFAELCSQAVPEDCKRPIKTVGAVGVRKDDGLTICNYLDSFDKGNSTNTFKPSKLIHYFYEGSRLKGGYQGYRLILDGIVRCGRISNSKLSHQDGTQSGYSTTYIRKYLRESGLMIDFNILIKSLIENDITEGIWNESVTSLFSYLNLHDLTQIQEFIYFESDTSLADTVNNICANKVYTDFAGRLIENEVATIHAVKGETHAATLVLETKFRSYDLKLLIDYILAENNTKPIAATKIKFMKQLYVAFSRPEYLLCLAMDKSGFPPEHVGKQDYAGWKICDLTIM
ncbi:UvrD-helicase domain-containing protein [Vibrio vulnificus]|uniref:UvrD-helicase domain-containing protein n=1 Tax=Vibrio vulnificus TaxID=672 RepID=UPI003ED871C2